MLGPFTKNQKPASSIAITVTNVVTNNAVDLSVYESAQFLLASPNGEQIDTSAGACSITNDENGTVIFQWPTDSLLTEVGDYRWQLKLTAPDIEDYTQPQTFEVYNTVA